MQQNCPQFAPAQSSLGAKAPLRNALRTRKGHAMPRCRLLQPPNASESSDVVAAADNNQGGEESLAVAAVPTGSSSTAEVHHPATSESQVGFLFNFQSIDIPTICYLFSSHNFCF
jgi:hypothetical protein